MACGAPSSVTVKSFIVSPSTLFPLLSRTVTVSITSWVLLLKVASPVASFAGGAGGFCADAVSKKVRAQAKVLKLPLWGQGFRPAADRLRIDSPARRPAAGQKPWPHLVRKSGKYIIRTSGAALSAGCALHWPAVSGDQTVHC